MISVLTGGSPDPTNMTFGSEELNSDRGKAESSHEMRAFMRMFMDLVGIFNEGSGSEMPEDCKLPGGMSFSMMFGDGSPPRGERIFLWTTIFKLLPHIVYHMYIIIV